MRGKAVTLLHLRIKNAAAQPSPFQAAAKSLIGIRQRESA